MALRNPLPVIVGGLLVVALVAADPLPALHGVPLILLALAAAIQIGREMAVALPAKGLRPPAPVMNFANAIILLHVAYLRTDLGSTLLEVVMTGLVAVFTLVLFAAIGSDCKDHGLRAMLRDHALGWGLTLAVAGGYSFALLLQVRPPSTGVGSLLVAALVAGSWLASAAGVAWGRGAASDLVRLAVPVVLLVAAGQLTVLGGWLDLSHCLAVGLLVGAATLVGERLVAALRRWCGVDNFRTGLPHQFAALEPYYGRLYDRGITDYGATLALVFPLVWAYCRWAVR